jgi:hypothetical protein
MSTNAERFQQLAEKVYPRHVPKPAGPRIVNGWRELPGGGWVTDGTVVWEGKALSEPASLVKTLASAQAHPACRHRSLPAFGMALRRFD